MMMKRCFYVVSAIAGVVGLCWVHAGTAGEMKVQPKIEITAEPFELTDVKLLDSPLFRSPKSGL